MSFHDVFNFGILFSSSRLSRKGTHEHPRTPDPYELQSKRAFDGRIKIWRKELHKWDNLPIMTSSASEMLSTNSTLDGLASKCNPGLITSCDPSVSIDNSFEAYLSTRNKNSANPNCGHDEDFKESGNGNEFVGENSDDDSDIL